MVQAAPIDIEKTAGELAVRSFEAFCEDIGGMFGVEISCSHEATLRCTIAELKKNFSKLSAVSLVAAKGAINREFRLIFDKKGLFALAGTVMMLPEERTHQLCKLGDVKNAQEIADSVCEIGNLLVGSWDRIFREAMEGHGHFVKKDVFIGDPLLEPSQHLGASADDEILCVTCSMTVAPYAPFKCGAIFPIPLLLHAASEPPKAVEATAVAEHPKDKLPENTTPDSQPAAPA
ncbi:MAG TPA: hypothetical protein VLH60_06695, partial [Sedimentisphaerales bacterium]|nr:hypothetical protein [Sedimentisphaerales bacterium]